MVHYLLVNFVLIFLFLFAVNWGMEPLRALALKNT